MNVRSAPRSNSSPSRGGWVGMGSCSHQVLSRPSPSRPPLEREEQRLLCHLRQSHLREQRSAKASRYRVLG